MSETQPLTADELQQTCQHWRRESVQVNKKGPPAGCRRASCLLREQSGVGRFRRLRRLSGIVELLCIEVDIREFVFLVPVVLRVLPDIFGAALRQEVHGPHEIARIEVLRIDPGQDFHVLVFLAQLHAHLADTLLIHMLQEAGDEVAHQVDPQRPRSTEVSEHPCHVRHTGEHHAAIGHRLREIDRLVIHRERNIAEDGEIEARRRDDDIGFQFLATLGQDALLREAFDLVGHHIGLAGGNALEQVPIRHEGDPLAPRAVAGREVLVDRVVFAEEGLHAFQQFLRDDVFFFEAPAREVMLVKQHFLARDPVDRIPVDADLLEFRHQLVFIPARNEIGRRALQHGDMLNVSGDGWHHGGRRCARADADDFLAFEVNVFRPKLRVDDLALELVHVRPVRRVGLGVIIVALAHPEEVAGESQHFVRFGAAHFQGPEAVLGRPFGRQDLVAVADVLAEIILLDHFAHIGTDLFRRRDRRAGPRLETIAKRVEVGVRPDARIFVPEPCAAKAFQLFQHRIALPRALRFHVIRRTDAGNPGSRNEHIEVFYFALGGLRFRFRPCHGSPSI